MERDDGSGPVMRLDHGTMGAYLWGRCRCDVCKEGNRVRTKEWRANNRDKTNTYSRDYQRRKRQEAKDMDAILTEVLAVAHDLTVSDYKFRQMVRERLSRTEAPRPMRFATGGS